MPDLETVKNLFGIPVVSKSSTDHDDDNYGNLEASESASFDEKVNEVRSLVSDKEETENIKQLNKSEINTDIKDSLKKSVLDAKASSDKKESGIDEDKVFDSLGNEESADEESIDEKSADGESADEESVNEKSIDEESVDEENVDEKDQLVSKVTNLEDWNLISPSPKFNQFYAEKANIIKHLLKSQERLNFEPLMDELSNAHVDATVPIFDQRAIHERMQEVQGWRNRVKQVQMTCNKQHFKWKMALELLKGLLARIEYAKPAIKQEGVIFAHLADVCLYYADLESLYDSADKVSKNLDNAFVTLSRQLSIAMPERPLERKGDGLNLTHERDGISGFKEKKSEVQKTEELPENLKNFDSLVDNDTISNENTKPEKVDSNDIADTSWDDLI